MSQLGDYLFHTVLMNDFKISSNQLPKNVLICFNPLLLVVNCCNSKITY